MRKDGCKELINKFASCTFIFKFLISETRRGHSHLHGCASGTHTDLRIQLHAGNFALKHIDDLSYLAVCMINWERNEPGTSKQIVNTGSSNGADKVVPFVRGESHLVLVIFCVLSPWLLIHHGSSVAIEPMYIQLASFRFCNVNGRYFDKVKMG